MNPLCWCGDKLKILDQRLLPGEVKYIECADWRCVAVCIKDMAVRGAPAIGAAAAYGMALVAREACGKSKEQFLATLTEAALGLKQTRPTAVNLAWAVDKVMAAVKTKHEFTPAELAAVAEAEAERIATEDVAVNRRIGDYGAELIKDGANILTHCNAGALATVGYGTALGIIRSVVASGKKIMVYADETRPYLQGARLTAWELSCENIPVTLIADNMAGFLMRQKKVDAVIVGADRIAANGDVANKIGTYSLAVLAAAHKIPFYVAAPFSTFDISLKSGDEIPIEERCAEELSFFQGVRIAPEGVHCYNPSFDVTPAELITAIVTESGIIESPNTEKVAKLLGEPK
jgi:methylthioribose-1-phosphate isomerase